MASINTITDIIASIKTLYAYYARDTDITKLATTWHGLLKEYDDQVVEAAMFKCLQTCKTPPTPADVIEQIKSMYRTLERSDEELWSDYKKALRFTCDQMRRFGYTFIDSSGISQGDQARRKVDEIWNGLDEKIKSYLGDKSELMRNASAWGADENAFFTWEKPRFLKCLPIIEKRREYSGLAIASGSEKFLLKGD